MVVLFVGTTLYHNSKDEDLLSLLSFTYIWCFVSCYGINYHILSLELIVIISLKKTCLIVIYISYAQYFIVFAVTSGICYPRHRPNAQEKKGVQPLHDRGLGVAFGLLQISHGVGQHGNHLPMRHPQKHPFQRVVFITHQTI